jgi:hypothetical protein
MDVGLRLRFRSQVPFQVLDSSYGHHLRGFGELMHVLLLLLLWMGHVGVLSHVAKNKKKINM